MGAYIVFESMGSGAFGEVFKAMHMVSGEMVAIKRLKLSTAGSQLPMREADALSKAGTHHHCLSVLEVRDTEEEVFLVTDYCKGGDLYDYCFPSELSVRLPLSLAFLLLARILFVCVPPPFVGAGNQQCSIATCRKSMSNLIVGRGLRSAFLFHFLKLLLVDRCLRADVVAEERGKYLGARRTRSSGSVCTTAAGP